MMTTDEGQCGVQALSQPAIEVDEMRIEIVELRALRKKTERHGQSAAKRFHQAAMDVRLPERQQMGDKPAFASRPFERRTDSRNWR
jgi:hypothetical protein